MSNNLSPKNFYSIAEFYNFIRKADTSPAGSRFMVLVPYPSDGTMPKKITNSDLYKLSITMQKIQLPEIVLNGNNVNGNLSVTTPLGNWQTIGNTTAFPGSTTLKIGFLETQEPIIEKIIYPWYLECLNSNGNSVYPFPRLDFAIKFYRKDIIKKQEPTFIYYFKGAYPSAIELSNVDHAEVR